MANPYGTYTLFKRETKRFTRVWTQTLMAPVISNLLYLAIFGLSLHKAIPDVQGVSYLEFLVPGLIIMGIINNAYQNPSSSIIIMKYQGIIYDIMSIPLKRYELLIAFISSAVLRGLIVGFATYLTAIFFVDFHYVSIPIIITAAILVSLFFAFAGLFTGIWADEFDKTALVQNFIIMPLIFLGGVFYPISTLPETIKDISSLNPIVHMINLLRYGLTGVKEFSIQTSFIVVISCILVAGTITYLVLRNGWKLQD